MFSRLALLSLTIPLVACNSSDSTPMNTCLSDGCAPGQTCNAATGVCESRVALTAASESGGQVASAGNGCAGATCSVLPQTQVTLTATPEAGFRFLGWTGSTGCAGETANPLTVTVTQAMTCTATFVRRFTVQGSATGAQAVVTASAPGADPVTCEANHCEVDTGASVVLLAPVVPGFYVTGWTGDGCPTAGSQITVLADADRSCTATYAPGLPVAGTVTGRLGAVTATSETPGQLCAANQCTVPPGATVVLTRPTDDPRGRWLGWFGDCTGTTDAVTLTNVTAATSCEARFAPRLRAVGVTSGPTAAVTVETTDEHNVCEPGGCYLEAGFDVTMTAPDVPGWQFNDWSGDCEATGSTQTTIFGLAADASCTAEYTQLVTVLGEPSDNEATIQARSDSFECTNNQCLVTVGTTVDFHVSSGWIITDVAGTGCSMASDEGVPIARIESAAFDGQTCDITVAPFLDISLTQDGGGSVEFIDVGGLDCTSDGSFARCRGAAGGSLTALATPFEGGFVEWVGDTCPFNGNTEASHTFTTTGGDYTCQATFSGL